MKPIVISLLELLAALLLGGGLLGLFVNVQNHRPSWIGSSPLARASRLAP